MLFVRIWCSGHNFNFIMLFISLYFPNYVNVSIFMVLNAICSNLVLLTQLFNLIMLLMSPCFQNYVDLNIFMLINGMSYNLVLLTQLSLHRAPNISLFLKLRWFKDMHASKYNFLELGTSDAILIWSCSTISLFSKSR